MALRHQVPKAPDDTTGMIWEVVELDSRDEAATAILRAFYNNLARAEATTPCDLGSGTNTARLPSRRYPVRRETKNLFIAPHPKWGRTRVL